MTAIVDFLRELVLSFIPLFVAVDAIGVLPFMLAMTASANPQERKSTIRYALVTALGLGLGFIIIGKVVFSLLGIEAADFLVAGGLVLMALSIRDLLTGKIGEFEAGPRAELMGVVPIGTPLVVGPAVLTTLLLLTGQYSTWVVLLAFFLNLVIAWVIFSQANRIAAFLGQGGLRAASKIAGLFLAAIAVKMIRQGIIDLLG